MRRDHATNLGRVRCNTSEDGHRNWEWAGASSRQLIQQAIWLYFRFALSYRDVEDMLAERWAPTRYRSLEEQPGREFPSAIATTRTTDEALQVTRVGTALSLNPRHRLQCVQCPTPSDLPPNPARVLRSDYADMAPRYSRSVNRCGHAHLGCNFPINVTVPP